MIGLKITFDITGFRRWEDKVRRQVPFATAQTLNVVGNAAIEAERKAEQQQLDRPRPFTTQQGLRLVPARKNNLRAVIYIPPIQARYLAPEILGGSQVLNSGSRAVLRPVDQATDQYGNLPRGLLARLRGRRDIFIGTIKGVDGVWQRLTARQGKRHAKSRGLPTGSAPPRLRLLVRFSDPVPVKTRYRVGEAGLATARVMFWPEFWHQLRLAMRTARCATVPITY